LKKQGKQQKKKKFFSKLPGHCGFPKGGCKKNDFFVDALHNKDRPSMEVI